MSYILAFDQGTTSSRSIVFNHYGEIVSMAQAEFRQIYPRPGWVEHDPQEIFASQAATAVEAIRKCDLTSRDIAAVGITNQRETTIVWDRQNGLPIYNAIVWQDRRTSEFCDQIRSEHSELIKMKTGLEVDAYFSASKLQWLLDNIPGARNRAERGELAFGTVDTWLIWSLTGGKIHATDVSNASRTMFFNIHTRVWDDELLNIFDIPHMLLPEIKGSSGFYGEIRTPNALDGVSITGVAGDQQAALFGQSCFETGSTKCTYGTGCFMLQNTGARPAASRNRLLSTVGWQIAGSISYALEGSVFIGGAVFQWLRDSLGIIKSSDEINGLAGAVSDNGGVYFVPALTGLGAPHWDQRARGMIIGLTRGTGKEHIARAALESIAFQSADLLTAMNADSHADLKELKVDGGATRNDLLLQFLSDVLQIPVARAKVTETTALGAAFLAGLSCGFWASTREVSELSQADRIFQPQMPPSKAAELKQRWDEAVERSRHWDKS